MPDLPAGHILVENLNHIIKEDDYYMFNYWRNRFYADFGSYWQEGIGEKVGDFFKKHQDTGNPFVIYSNGPRFPTDKPYPYGY